MADRSTLGEIIEALRTELATYLEWGEARILPVARDEVPHFLGSSDILIRIGPETPQRPLTSGAGGRVVALVVRKVWVCPRTRSYLDKPDVDATRLLAADGHFALEDSVYDALQMWQPADPEDETRALLCEPARCGAWTEPKPDRREGAEDKTWRESRLEVELPYLRDLDLERGQ